MRQLRENTHLILDGEVRVYRREGLTGKPTSQLADGPNLPPAHCRACVGARAQLQDKRQVSNTAE